MSRRTEEAYRFWIRSYILLHHKQHPRDLGTGGILPYISHLAADAKVAASTQSQALNALLFLYRDALGIEVGHLEEMQRVQRMTRVPVVLTVEEVRGVLGEMHGTSRLMAEVLYGAGIARERMRHLAPEGHRLQRTVNHSAQREGGKGYNHLAAGETDHTFAATPSSRD